MNCPNGNVKECACPKKTCPNNGRCCACVIKHKETDSLRTIPWRNNTNQSKPALKIIFSAGLLYRWWGNVTQIRTIISRFCRMDFR